MTFDVNQLRFSLYWKPISKIFEDGSVSHTSTLNMVVINTSKEEIVELIAYLYRLPWPHAGQSATQAEHKLFNRPEADGLTKHIAHNYHAYFSDIRPHAAIGGELVEAQMDEGAYYWIGPYAVTGALRSGESFYKEEKGRLAGLLAQNKTCFLPEPPLAPPLSQMNLFCLSRPDDLKITMPQKPEPLALK